MVIPGMIVFWIPLIVVVVVLLWLWRKMLLNEPLEISKLKNVTIIIVGIYVLKMIFQVGLLYYSLKQNPLGMYLLPGQGTNYFAQSVWLLIQPLVLGILVGSGLVLLALAVKRLTKRPWFDLTDYFILFITGFLMGFPNVLLLLVGSLLLMIIWQIFVLLLLKRTLEERLSLSPFLILVTVIHLILINFDFYQQFLTTLRLR